MLHKIFLAVSLLLFTVTLNLAKCFAQKKQELKSDIQSATVYLNGAEIDRTARTSLAAGNTDVVFTGLPSNINSQTINVVSDSKLLIMSVQYKLNYLQPNELNAETKKWTDSIEQIDQQLVTISKHKELILMQQAMLDDNKKTTGANTGLNFEAVKQYYDYMSEKEWGLKVQWMDYENQEKKLAESRTRITQQVSEFMNKKNQPSGEIWVQVQTSSALNTTFELNYMVPSAGWTPEYDVRCDKVGDPAKLNYKASLWQNTGEDWKDIHLTLSTGNPSAGACGPVFSTWFMDYYNGGYNNYGKDQDGENYKYDSAEKQKMPAAQDYALKEVIITNGKTKKENETTSQYTQVNQSALATEFDIKLAANIPSDAVAHQVNIGDFDLTVTYDYYSIPRLDEDVFLNMHITDWEKLNLLDGNANIFFQGGYVGQSYIYANQAKDTLDISLGRDKKIVLKREKLKDFTKEKFIGDKYRQSVTYEVTVKNNESTDVNLEVMEQVPISANNNIKITLDDAGGAVYTQETGKLSWKMKLAPGEEKKMRFSITVEFPASIKNTVYCPRF
ncbi:MAG TPA: hypothetical protein DCQ93_04385 [Bacteroidetes bacterium]|nr:hypothetical protein [Bacteroidota bacterium]